MITTRILFVFLCLSVTPVAAQGPQSLQIQASSGKFVGLPIHWSQLDAALLEPTGAIQLFEQTEIVTHEMLTTQFQPESLQQAKIRLQQELGPSYDTTIAGPYVIAAPSGQVARWESRFRSLLSGYTRYFETRGWPLRKPDFPLVVIVLPDRQQFDQLSALETGARNLGSNLAGVYVPRTNRCLLYNLISGGSTDWQATEATIVHEAVHQLAYNTGLHERLFEHPLWFVEGLATMFEAPGIYDSSSHSPSGDNRRLPTQAARVKQLVGDDSELLGQYMDQLVSSDQMFRSSPQDAYALAWAMTFYLSERMPRQYLNYIELQRQRGFHNYSTEDRQLDFRRAFQLAPQAVAGQILKTLDF